MKFRPGDKVICVNDQASIYRLNIGKVYEVFSRDSVLESIFIVGSDLFWLEDRFIHYSPLIEEIFNEI